MYFNIQPKIVGKPINVGEQIFALTRNITYRAAFGSACEKGQDEFIRILQEFSKLFGAFNVADFIPYFGWIDPQGIKKRLVKARGDLDGFIDDIIDEHMKKKENQNTVDDGDVVDTDMVDDLLAFYSEEAKLVSEATDLQNSIKLTRDNIKAIIMVIIFHKALVIVMIFNALRNYTYPLTNYFLLTMKVIFYFISILYLILDNLRKH